jgi:predicted DNA-binding protein
MRKPSQHTEVMAMTEAVNFEIPKEINTRLDRLASMYGNLTAFVAMKAGYAREDIPVLIFRVAELYGVIQALGVIFGYKCTKEVRKAIDTFKDLFEEALDYMFEDVDNPDLLESIMRGLDKLHVASLMLIVGCAGLSAIVPAPENLGGDSRD